MDKTPLYTKSFDEAVKNDEVKLFHQSNQANEDCAKAINDVVRNNYDGYRLGKDLPKDVINNFGVDRVKFVLANTIQQKDWDGRISRDNKLWANETDVPKSSSFLVLDGSSGLLNIFTDQFKAMVKEIEKPPKFSVLNKLNNAKKDIADLPKNSPVGKDKEVR